MLSPEEFATLLFRNHAQFTDSLGKLRSALPKNSRSKRKTGLLVHLNPLVDKVFENLIEGSSLVLYWNGQGFPLERLKDHLEILIRPALVLFADLESLASTSRTAQDALLKLKDILEHLKNAQSLSEVQDRAERVVRHFRFYQTCWKSAVRDVVVGEFRAQAAREGKQERYVPEAYADRQRQLHLQPALQAIAKFKKSQS